MRKEGEGFDVNHDEAGCKCHQHNGIKMDKDYWIRMMIEHSEAPKPLIGALREADSHQGGTLWPLAAIIAVLLVVLLYELAK